MTDHLPQRARIVIIGAGAIGCSIAWGLTREGEKDVLVIEKSGVSHGSTWHAAGLVGQYRSRRDLTQLMQSSVTLYNEMQAEQTIDWRPVGSLRLASSAARWEEYRRAQPKARDYGVDFELIGPEQAKSLFPLIDLNGVVGAAYVKSDGYIDPSALAQGFASRARRGGAHIVEGVTVSGAERTEKRVNSILTDRGRVECEIVVLATGVWTRPVGRMFGLDIPVAALQHQYAVTEKRSDLPRDLPAMRDPDLNFYVKPDVGGFAIGGWEANTVPAVEGDMPFSFGPELLPDNIDRIAPILEAAGRRMPALQEMGLRRIINGPIPFSPDGEPMLGPAPGFDNLYVAVGFSAGIVSSGGAGRALAQWIAHGAPAFPLPSLDPGRFGSTPMPTAEVYQKAIAAYGAYYALSQPT